MIEKYNPPKHNQGAVKELLALALGNPTLERLQKLLEEFYVEDGHTLFVASDRSRLTGVIGLDHTAAPHGWIIHLAVRPDLRRRRIGKNLINHATNTLGLISIAAETDQDAVEFYRACGFEIREIESRWPGTRRFRFVKGQMPKFVLQYYDKLTTP
jgi:ribosomal protein S18 acetylase RimI-like enzyme